MFSVYNNRNYQEKHGIDPTFIRKERCMMRIVPGFIVRRIADQILAIPTGDAAHALSGLVALNGSGQLLFELLQTSRTESELVQAMLDAYDTDVETARADVCEFLTTLRSSGLLEED